MSSDVPYSKDERYSTVDVAENQRTNGPVHTEANPRGAQITGRLFVTHQLRLFCIPTSDRHSNDVSFDTLA